MKNAGELFKKWNTSADIGEGLDIVEFTEALTEHDNELISEIEKKMEKEELVKSQHKSKQNRIFHQGRYDLLTEIINLIKET